MIRLDGKDRILSITTTGQGLFRYVLISALDELICILLLLIERVQSIYATRSSDIVSLMIKQKMRLS